jgi:hypothetical protein
MRPTGRAHDVLGLILSVSRLEFAKDHQIGRAAILDRVVEQLVAGRPRHSASPGFRPIENLSIVSVARSTEKICAAAIEILIHGKREARGSLKRAHA